MDGNTPGARMTGNSLDQNSQVETSPNGSWSSSDKVVHRDQISAACAMRIRWPPDCKLGQIEGVEAGEPPPAAARGEFCKCSIIP